MTDERKTLGAWIYARESKGKAKSTDDQIALGIAAIAEERWWHAGTSKDGSSASRHARKLRDEWPELLKAMRNGAVDVLILWESSRGSREPVDWFGMLTICMERGILIHVISHERTYDPRKARDWKVLADDGVDAAHETNKTSERVLKGVARAAVAGLPHGEIPYGYERVYHEQTRKLVEQRPHPEHAPIAREIIRRIGRSEPIIRVVRDLNRRGIPAPRGGLWAANTVRKLCLNPAYIGKRRHDGELYDAVWDGLVSEDEFYAAARVLNRPGRNTWKPGQQRYLLSYIATSPCGKVLFGDREIPKRRRARYHCAADGCSSIGMAELDELVARFLVGRLCQPDARGLFVGSDAEARAARDEAARLRADLDEARDLVGKPPPHGLSAASLARIEANLVPMIEAADRRALRATAPAALTELLDAARSGTRAVREAWDSLPVAAQREVVSRLIVVRIEHKHGVLSWRATDQQRLDRAAERVVIDWHPHDESCGPATAASRHPDPRGLAG